MTAHAPGSGPATYEDLERVPDRLVAELIDGELFTSPRPASPHAYASSGLLADVRHGFNGPPRTGRPGGWWIVHEPELHLGRNVLVPDVAGWRLTTLPEFPVAPAIRTAPDWVCEVVSPSTARLDRLRKMPVYAREGVSHLWLVDPVERFVEAFRLTDDGAWLLVGQFGDTDTARIPPFDQTDLEIAQWWLPAPSPPREP